MGVLAGRGLAQDRWALVSTVHYCMVDGVSGTDLYRVVLDEMPVPRAPVADAGPSALRLGAAALDLARLPLASGLGALATALLPATPSSLCGPPSAERRFAFARGSVADVAGVRRALGDMVNDVALAAVTVGFRRLLLARGELPADHAVRTLIPVSVRPPGAANGRDNEASLLVAELLVHLADPKERLAGARQGVAKRKSEHEAEAGAAVVAIARYEPFVVVAAPVRPAAHPPQRSIVTDDQRARPAGAARRARPAAGRDHPVRPHGSTLRLGVAIFSYCGEVTVGITGDHDGAANVWTLAQGVEEGISELVSTASARGSHRRPG